MWTCPKCDAEVYDSVRPCWYCGTAPDGTAPPVMMPPFMRRARPVVASGVGVPRRFGLQKVMLMITGYAVMFAGMTALGAHPITFVVIAVFFTGVATAQALLFGGRDPRKASIVAGLVLCPTIILGGMVIAQAWFGEDIPFFGMCMFVFLGLIFGGPLGYMAGVFGAAVFLVQPEESKAHDDATAGHADPFAPVVEVVAEDPATEGSPNRGT